ncbi:SPOR domain-containing protein [Salinisphaera aquimarina]|uniref:SPOR domain-containing protein n=1 Tax=Salinisphaera aquimarina TaxID=2094031 RepID=A0ABV7EQ52_9GAMM
MSRDYSSRRNNPPTKGKRAAPQRRKPAAKSKPQKRSGGGGPPGWVWMLCGLCIGLTVAAGFYVFGRPAGTPAREQMSIATPNESASKAPAADEPAEAAAPAQKEEEPRFSFYKMLPNYEVVIPEEEYPEKKTSSHSSTPAGEPPAPAKPQPTTPKVDEPGSYIIQAGSFSTFADADRRKAELALLGVSARIVDVDLASGKTVYRVQSNVIGSSSKLNDMLKRLRENRIDTLVMRAKK